MQPQTTTPTAPTIPFGVQPSFHTIKTPRFKTQLPKGKPSHTFAVFGPNEAPRTFSNGADNLITYDLDIKQLFTDLMLKDILAEEDAKFISAAGAFVEAKGDLVLAEFGE